MGEENIEIECPECGFAFAFKAETVEEKPAPVCSQCGGALTSLGGDCFKCVICGTKC